MAADDWSVVGTAPAQVQNPWAVRNVAPAPVKGDAIGRANLEAQQKEQGPVQDTLDMLGHGATSAGRAALGLGNATLHPIDTLTHLAAALPGLIQHVTEAISNPAETAQHAGAVLSTMSGAEAGEKLGPLALGAGIGKGAGLLNDIAASAPAAAAVEAPAAVTKYGMRTAENNPIARNVAGSSGQPAVTAHNQSIADPILGAQAGISPGIKITPASLETARAAPDSVYQRAEASIPTGLLSPNAAQAVQSVGADDMIVHSPDTQTTIDAQKARLLSGPLTGSEVVNGQRALRFNGFRNVASEDPEQSALGQAQLKMADALHQHMVDTLPPDAPVSAEQLAAARVALAQNHTIESVLGPNGNVNLTKLAKVHNDNPGMLTGPMQEIAQFASDHPEVTRLPSDAERFNPSGVLKDVTGANILNRPVGAIAQVFGGKLARGVLTGPKVTPDVPVTGLGGEFGPLDRGAAPSGLGTPPSASPTGGGLADLLSNNASGESAASQEAINRTASEPPRFVVDPDGNMTPLKAEGAAAADYRPSKGSIVVQGGGPNGKPTIIDRGGLPESHANGLMNRAFSRKLGDEF